MSDASNQDVVVITGASAGVGRATARTFAARGANIGLLARGEDGLEGAKQDVEERGGNAVVVPTDVSEYDQVEHAAEAVEDEFGPIDVWINAAMTTVFSEVDNMSAEEYQRVTEVTYLGCVNGTLAALDRMRPRDSGSIVQVGSALAYRGIPLQSSYCASKHAIKGFTELLFAESIHQDSGVDISIVELPGLNTPQFTWVKNRFDDRPQPVPPVYQPEVAADAIVWAAHHDRRELFVGLPTLKTVLSEKLAPRLVDRYLAKNGYSSQLSDEPEEPDRESNLWSPVPGDRGAHGPYEDRTRGASAQLWASTHRRILGIAGGAVATMAGLLYRWRTD